MKKNFNINWINIKPYMVAKYWQEKFDWLLFLMPAVFPLYLLRFDLIGIPSNLVEVLIIICFLGQLFLNWKSFKHINRWIWLMFAVFLLAALIGTLIVPKELLLIDGSTVFESKKIALGILKGWIVLPVIYFLTLVARVKKPEQILFSLYAYIFSAFPLVIWAFWQYLSGDFITLDGRASGPFVNANYLAMYLAPAVTALWIIVVKNVINGLKLKEFLVGVILAVLFSITMLMTQSYGAMMAVMFSLIIFLIFALKIHKKFQRNEELGILKKIGYFLAVFAGIAIMSAVVLYAGTEKWKLFTEFKQRSSNSVRLQVYEVSKSLILENPILGLGLGQFPARYDLESPRILGKTPYELIMLHPHNTILSFWLNMGLAGVSLYLLLVFLVFREMFKISSVEQGMFKIIGFSMFLAMFLHGMVDSYFFKNDLALLFWLIIALIFLPEKIWFSGIVEEGQKLGRKLGFPTANFSISNSNKDLGELSFGVYAVSSKIDGKKVLGAMSYGPRPTVENTGIPTAEVHYLDYSGDLYGQVLKVEIEEFIRLIFKFKNLEELKANIDNDLKLIRERVKLN